MTAEIVIIIFQTLLLMMLFPLEINVKAHASLSRKCVQADLCVFNAAFVRFRIDLNRKPYVTINGKSVKYNEKRKQSASKMIKAIEFIKNEKMLKDSQTVAYMAFNDAKNSAIACALLAVMPIAVRAYESRNERFDADCALNLKINVLQAMRLIALANEG